MRVCVEHCWQSSANDFYWQISKSCILFHSFDAGKQTRLCKSSSTESSIRPEIVWKVAILSIKTVTNNIILIARVGMMTSSSSLTTDQCFNIIRWLFWMTTGTTFESNGHQSNDRHTETIVSTTKLWKQSKSRHLKQWLYLQYML